MDDRIAQELVGRVGEMLAASTQRLESKIGDVESRVDGLRGELTEFRAAMESNYGVLVSRFDGLETRLSQFEAKVYLRFDSVDERFGAFERRLAIIEQRP